MAKTILILLNLAQFSWSLTLTIREKQVLLECHNIWRSKLAKDGAANMHEIYYDEELENDGQTYLERKMKQGVRIMNEKGVTLFGSLTAKNGEDLISKACEQRRSTLNFTKLQVGEIKQYTLRQNSRDDAVQMIWGEASRIGCVTNRFDSTISKKGYMVLYCKYSVPIKDGVAIYTTGKTCEHCEARCNTTTGLCGRLYEPTVVTTRAPRQG